jgi:hypothetical protein
VILPLILHLTYKLRFLTINFEEISELSSQLVRFYSVKLGPDPVCEFEKFDSTEFENPIHIDELQVIYSTIEEIRQRGAKAYYFHPEGPAEALPKVTKLMKEKNKGDFGLRLYCIHISENTVILLNGGIKTKHDPMECPNVKIHFGRALKIAVRLKKAVADSLVHFSLDGIAANFEIDI